MSTCIQNSALRGIAWCQEKTLQVSDSLPANHIILDIVKRVLIVATLIIPLIGLIANYLECNKHVAQTVNILKEDLTRKQNVCQSSALQILHPPGKKLSPAPSASQVPPTSTPVNPQKPSPPAPNTSQVPPASTPVNPQAPSASAPNGREDTEGFDQHLSFNVLTDGPIFIEMPALYIDESGQSLTEPPNVSNNPELQTLYLSHNQLTTPPDVSKNPALQTLLDQSGTELTQTPDVSKYPALQALYMTEAGLTESPDVSQNPALQTLDLQFNRLTEPPNVIHNRALQTLDLKVNKLTSPPIVIFNPALQTLDLKSNKLTVPPNVTHNPALQTLDLSMNELTKSPDVSNNPALKTLNLSCNQLRILPASILDLPSDCTVDATNNEFSDTYIIQFKQILAEHRPQNGPTVLLTEQDARWHYKLDD